MFLSTVFREKLKRDFLEGDIEDQGGAKYRYQPNPEDKRRLIFFHENIKLNAKDPSPFIRFNSQQLKALGNKEWENTFNLKNLHARWEGKTNLDFDNNFKKFTDDIIPSKVIASKKYIKNLVDPDVLQKKKRNFNLSTDPNAESKPEVQKNLFEVGHGLKNFTIVPIKEKTVEEGVDTRNYLTIDNNTWNKSNLLDEKNLKQRFKEDLFLAQDNSNRYWKENEDNRNMETQIPITEERKKVETPRYFKKYRTPFQRTIEYSKTMNKIIQDCSVEKENMEKNLIKKYPFLVNCPEKLNALVFKEMDNVYKSKYNDFINRTKQNKRDEDTSKEEFTKFKWNDVDLANKIIAIDKLQKSGILLTPKNNTRNNRINLSYDKKSKRYLLPLVIKGQTIFNEEDKIHEKLKQALLKQRKKELLMEQKKFKKMTLEQEFNSKYPQNKEDYNISKTMGNLVNNKLDIDDNNLETKNFSNKDTIENPEELMNQISTNSGCGPHFLEAYSKIADKELEKMKETNKRLKEQVTIKYIHPGTYRAFTFKEKIPKPKPVKKKEDFDINGENEQVPAFERDDYIEKKITEYYWSCCMNTDQNSQGCQKIEERNFKYLYD